VSLFNNVSETVEKNTTVDRLYGKEGASGMSLGGLASSVGGVLIGGALSKAVNKAIPPKTQGAIRSAVNDPGAFILDKLRPGLGGALSQERFWNTKTPLFGGITPKRAKEIYDAAQAEPRAKKNLFLLQVTSELRGYEAKFNLFATEVDYAPYTVTGEKRHVGLASVDAVTAHEPVELRITTLDDVDGTLKRWFAAHSRLVGDRDGTVGVPADYAVRFHILHSRIVRDTDSYIDAGLFRPASIELSLSRREDAMQELQMTFTQLDSFMR